MSFPTHIVLLFLLLGVKFAPTTSWAPASAVDALSLFNLANNGGEVETSPRSCYGLIGDCINQEEETMMESESSRRGLQSGPRYISYGALMKNRVPCNRRGSSYYNCRKDGAKRANPYRRGCTYITHCARYLN